MITQTLDLNLIPGRVLPMVNVSQYDKDSRTLEFTIYNGDQTFDLTGLSAYIQGLKPDGHGFNYSATVSTGKITADVTEQMTAVSGRVMCEVIIMSGADRIGTGNFILNVEAAAMPDGSNMSESDYSYIEQLIEDAQEAVTDAEAWAVGERGGVPVGPTDPTYENSAHYWAQQASGAVNDMTGATESTPGTHGLVPAPSAGDQDKVLMGDGTWKAPSGGSDMTGATAGSAGTHGLVPAPAAGDQDKVLMGDGTWKAPSGGSDMTGATAGSAGTHGLVPAPAAGDQDKFLKGDGTWGTPSGGGGSTEALGPSETIGSAAQRTGGYAVGEYFVGDDGKYYEVTASIAEGATITVGTNCEETTVGEQLSELNADINSGYGIDFDTTKCTIHSFNNVSVGKKMICSGLITFKGAYSSGTSIGNVTHNGNVNVANRADGILLAFDGIATSMSINTNTSSVVINGNATTATAYMYMIQVQIA